MPDNERDYIVPEHSATNREQRTVPNTHAGSSDIELFTLSYGEIAIALHIAGLPVRWQQLSTRALIDLALDGVAKVGLEEVLRIYAESQRVLVVLSASKKTSGPERSRACNQLRHIWQSRRSRQNATDAAWTIFHPIKAQVVTRNSGRRWITN